MCVGNHSLPFLMHLLFRGEVVWRDCVVAACVWLSESPALLACVCFCVFVCVRVRVALHRLVCCVRNVAALSCTAMEQVWLDICLLPFAAWAVCPCPLLLLLFLSVEADRGSPLRSLFLLAGHGPSIITVDERSPAL